MRHIILIERDDHHTGEVLLRLKGVPLQEGEFMHTRDGRLIAHDLIEHQNGLHNIGPVQDELEAFGAIWWVRGQHADISRGRYSNIHSPETVLGWDIAAFYEQFPWSMQAMHDDLKGKRLRRDEEFEYIVAATADSIRDNRRYGGSPEIDTPFDSETYLRYVEHCLCVGIGKARRRFQGESYRANRQFWAITEAIDDCVKRLDLEACEGLRLNLSWGSGEANCKLIEEYY